MQRTPVAWPCNVFNKDNSLLAVSAISVLVSDEVDEDEDDDEGVASIAVVVLFDQILMIPEPPPELDANRSFPILTITLTPPIDVIFSSLPELDVIL